MKLNRLSVNILTLLIYLGAQFITLIPGLYYKSKGLSYNEINQIALSWLPPTFIVATILIVFLHTRVKNETRLERSRKAKWTETLIWMFAGVFLAFFAQMIMGMINVYILNQPIESQNTKNLMQVAKKMPMFIILISVFGPILEEYVFRKVIFGELFEFLKFNRVIAFIISGLISGLIFAAAHGDFDHTLIYLGMAFVFSGLYVATKRIIVPMFAHAMMNTTVVLVQLVFADKLEHLQQQAKQTAQIILHIIQ